MQLTQLDCTLDNELIALYIQRWRRYSLSFYIEALQADKYWYPTFQQFELCQLTDRHKHIAIKAGRGVGKTNFLAFRVLHHLICFRVPGLPVKVPITGPTGGQLSDVIWAEIPAMMEHLLPWLADRFVINNDILYCKELPKNWFASPRTARLEAPSSMAGHHGSTLNIYDEMSGLQTKLVQISTAGMTQETAYSLAAGNPDRLSGYFYNIWKENYRRWTRYSISCKDCRLDTSHTYPYVDPYGDTRMISSPGLISAGWFEDQKDELGEGTPLWSAYVLGEFPESEQFTLIRNDFLKSVYTNPKNENRDRPRIMGIDPGVELTPSAIVIRKGNDVEFAQRYYGLEAPQLAAAAEDIFDRWRSNNKAIQSIGVDDIGVGHGTRAILSSDGYPAASVKASQNPPDYGVPCVRMRDWLWWQSKCFFMENKVHFFRQDSEFDQLKKELGSVNQKPYKNGKFNAQDKYDLLKQGQDSPNLADALNLTFKLDFAMSTLKKITQKVDAYSVPDLTENKEWKVL